MLAYGRYFFMNKFYVADGVVVTVSILLEMMLKVKEGGLLVLLISWRVLRIVHGLFSTFEIEAAETEKKVSKILSGHHEETGKAFGALKCALHGSGSDSGGGRGVNGTGGTALLLRYCEKLAEAGVVDAKELLRLSPAKGRRDLGSIRQSSNRQMTQEPSLSAQMEAVDSVQQLRALGAAAEQRYDEGMRMFLQAMACIRTHDAQMAELEMKLESERLEVWASTQKMKRAVRRHSVVAPSPVRIQVEEGKRRGVHSTPRN